MNDRKEVHLIINNPDPSPTLARSQPDSNPTPTPASYFKVKLLSDENEKVHVRGAKCVDLQSLEPETLLTVLQEGHRKSKPTDTLTP